MTNGLSLRPGIKSERFKDIKRKARELESKFQGDLKVARSENGSVNMN